MTCASFERLEERYQKEWSNFRFAAHRFKDPYTAEWLNFHPVRPHVSNATAMVPNRTTGIVLRGTESLLTRRWRGLDSNF
jgi:hypothetical protein